uniref:SNF2_N domain-containing protein n=1 Tax=Rhabditophanes sp. KR3021 TaxID=114890 RepID=A0AC35TUU5_9BILA
MSPSRSFCTCCQFWGKDKKREGAYSEDLEAGGIADQVVAMPVRLESKDIPKLYKTTELGVLDEVHLQNKEDLRRGSDAFITARTARQDIVEDYRSMEQLVREIRQEHGFQETPRSNKDDKEGNCQSQGKSNI